jgi:hypothetical protein
VIIQRMRLTPEHIQRLLDAPAGTSKEEVRRLLLEGASDDDPVVYVDVIDDGDVIDDPAILDPINY